MALSPAEQERRLKQRLKTELEKRGYFVKFSQSGGVTVLMGQPGGEQEVIVSDMTITEAGQFFKVWGAPNPCLTAEQREHPDRDPNDPSLDTPQTAAIRADTRQEVGTMSSKPSPRERARQIISDFETGKGAFAGISKAKATPKAAKPTPGDDQSADSQVREDQRQSTGDQP